MHAQEAVHLVVVLIDSSTRMPYGHRACAQALIRARLVRLNNIS